MSEKDINAKTEAQEASAVATIDGYEEVARGGKKGFWEQYKTKIKILAAGALLSLGMHTYNQISPSNDTQVRNHREETKYALLIAGAIGALAVPKREVDYTAYIGKGKGLGE